MNPTLLILLYLYLLYFAGVPAWRYIRVANRLHRAANWIEVKATLKDARVLKQKEPSTSIGRLFAWIKLARQVPCFWAIYRVEGRHFGCLRPTLYPYATRHELQIIRNLHGKEGDEVTLFVDPKEPHRSCYLSPNRHRTGWLILKMVFAVGCAAIAGLWVGGH